MKTHKGNKVVRRGGKWRGSPYALSIVDYVSKKSKEKNKSLITLKIRATRASKRSILKRLFK